MLLPMRDKIIYIQSTPSPGALTLCRGGQPLPLWASANDYPGVLRVVEHLQKDLALVTGHTPVLLTSEFPAAQEFILAGTLGKNPLIDRLVAEHRIDVSDVSGKWEACLIQVVEAPFAGVERCLVIAGSDKRGTMFGIFDLSEQLGVSPWYWWADVPVKPVPELYMQPGRYTLAEPAVRYRGIFINDEQPCLDGWVKEKFGGFNSHFYAKVFELLLRLKANYLWPAMWNSAFNTDDPENPRLADEYGIVMGTSHHEPMQRAQKEWHRFGSGEWDYTTNTDTLQKFWKQGIVNMGSHESIITLGMRGDGDMPINQEHNIALLEEIITDQRSIIEKVTGKAAQSLPQNWVLYKEVQEYYDLGMQVPDDVILMLCDDNWGNIRRLPVPGAPPRTGGYGLYYHFDYVGGPRNYKWINTSPLPRVWEQLHLAYEHGIDRIWIVNVGDIKPLEFPISFFLDYARNPEQWPAQRLDEYTVLWAEQQFGAEHAPAIARLLTLYTMYNGRRKPELLTPDTYSLYLFHEAERVTADYNELLCDAQKIEAGLPTAYQAAFYQLVLHPIQACANLYALYTTVARNRLYATQKRSLTNTLAEQAEALFAKDAEITRFYHEVLAGGKWNHMMAQTHIGYTYWQQPPQNTMPEVRRIPEQTIAESGVAVEGASDTLNLAVLTPYTQQAPYFEVFNRGQTPCVCFIESGAEWLHCSASKLTIVNEERIYVTADWEQAPHGEFTIPITVKGANMQTVVIQAVIQNPQLPQGVTGFMESSGYVSIEAEHFTQAIAEAPCAWLCIPGLGRTLSGMTLLPSTMQPPNNQRLEYTLYLINCGIIRVQCYVSPTIDFRAAGGLKYAIAFDNEPQQIINIHQDSSMRAWEQTVRDNINCTLSEHHITKPGVHTLKLTAIDRGLVLQKLVVWTGEIRPCYLGPPESVFIKA